MEIIQDGLVLYLDGVKNTVDTHDDTAKVWIDKTGNGNNGTLSNCGWEETGLYFHGLNSSYVNLGEINYEYMTAEIRVDIDRVFTAKGDDYFFCNCENGGFYFCVNSLGIIEAGIYINKTYHYVTGSSTSKNKINYYSFTYDGLELILYENGIPVDKLEIEGIITSPSSGTPLTLGGNPNAKGEITDSYFKGTIYSVRLYDRALTKEEIKNNYDFDITYFARPPIVKDYEIEWDALNANYVTDKAGYSQRCDNSSSGYSGYYSWFRTITFNKVLFGMAGIQKDQYYDYCYGLILSLEPKASVMEYQAGNWQGAGTYQCTTYQTKIEHNGYIWYLTYAAPRTGNYRAQFDNYSGKLIGTRFTSVEAAARSMLDQSNIVYSKKQIYPPQTNRIKYVKVREDNGTYSDAILLAVDALNVDFPDNENLIQKMAKKAEKAIYGDDGIHLGRKTDSEQGTNTHALGFSNSIPGDYGVAEGQNNIIYGQFGHTEGQENTIDATTEYGHAEGYKNQVNGNYGHAEGQENTVSGIGAHAEGLRNAATGDYSHAQGQNNVASGAAAAVMGEDTTAEGIASLAIGKGTTAKGNYSFVHGKYNSTKNYDRYAEIVGGGETPEAGDNIYTLDWQGNAKFKGNLTAELFNGKVTKDIKGRNLTTYIRDLSAEKNELTLIRGDGTEKTVTLRGWQNVQEKYNSLTNENAIIVGKSPVEIITMEYMNETNQIGNAIFQSTIIVYADVDINQTHAIVKFDIKIDDLSVDNGLFIPTETLCKGYHIINLMYPVMNISLKEIHIITVDATCVTGNIAIGKNNIKTVFYGMGINSGKTRWDGRIDVSDTFEGFNINKRLIQKSLEIGELFTVDNILVETQAPQLSDSIFRESFETFTLNKRINRKSINVNNETLFNPVLTVAPVILFYSLNINKIGYLLFNQNYVKISSDETKFILNDLYSVLSTDYGEIGSGYLTSLDLSLIDNIKTINTIEIKEENLE